MILELQEKQINFEHEYKLKAEQNKIKLIKDCESQIKEMKKKYDDRVNLYKDQVNCKLNSLQELFDKKLKEPQFHLQEYKSALEENQVKQNKI